MHRYTKFHIEVQALKKWLLEVDKLNDRKPYDTLKDFRKANIPSQFWNAYDKIVEEIYATKGITKNEKVIYLHEIGLGMNKIQHKLRVAPNTIVDLVRKRPQYRHLPENLALDMLIKDWKPFRQTLPDEFFIKYLT